MLPSQQFYPGLDDFHCRNASNQIQRLLTHLIDVSSFIGHTGKAQDGFLPQVLFINFGYREVELVSQPILETQEDLPLVLQRLTLGNEQLDRAEPDDHTHGQTYALKFCGNLVDCIGFDDIPCLDVVEILDANSTLVTLLHFTDVVLEATQRPEFSLIDHYVIANHSHSDSRAGNRAIHHIRPRDNASFGHREDLSHFGPTQRPLLERRLQQALHRG